MNENDPLRAIPTLIEDGWPAFMVQGHPTTLRYFVEALDGVSTDNDFNGRGQPRKCVVWPVYLHDREWLKDRLRDASDRSRVDLVIEPEGAA